MDGSELSARWEANELLIRLLEIVSNISDLDVRISLADLALGDIKEMDPALLPAVLTEFAYAFMRLPSIDVSGDEFEAIIEAQFNTERN